jgi:hypothetical protein
MIGARVLALVIIEGHRRKPSCCPHPDPTNCRAVRIWQLCFWHPYHFPSSKKLLAGRWLCVAPDGLQRMFGEEEQDGGCKLICLLYAGVQKVAFPSP